MCTVSVKYIFMCWCSIWILFVYIPSTLLLIVALAIYLRLLFRTILDQEIAEHGVVVTYNV